MTAPQFYAGLIEWGAREPDSEYRSDFGRLVEPFVDRYQLRREYLTYGE